MILRRLVKIVSVCIILYYKVQIVSLYKVFNSIPKKKGDHVLVQEKCVYKVVNSEILYRAAIRYKKVSN